MSSRSFHNSPQKDHSCFSKQQKPEEFLSHVSLPHIWNKAHPPRHVFTLRLNHVDSFWTINAELSCPDPGVFKQNSPHQAAFQSPFELCMCVCVCDSMGFLLLTVHTAKTRILCQLANKRKLRFRLVKEPCPVQKEECLNFKVSTSG